MNTNIRSRIVRFTYEDGCLVRIVTGPDGRRYTQRCSRTVYTTLAHAVSEAPAQGEGTTAMLLARQEGLPFTQVNVAVEFLKERSLIAVRHRRCYPNSSCLFEEAMVAFLAMTEEHPHD